MNKAAFLHIVRQVAPIQDQEVDDLEKLVVSFPYCQTAHVLLAKAAYDRGSMLSTQKLRRAAAHASNRLLLKQLVYSQPTAFTTTSTGVVEEPEPVPVLEQFSEKEARNSLVPEVPESERAEFPESNVTSKVSIPVAAPQVPNLSASIVPVIDLPGEEDRQEDSEAPAETSSITFDPSVAPETSILEALEALDEEELSEDDETDLAEEGSTGFLVQVPDNKAEDLKEVVTESSAQLLVEEQATQLPDGAAVEDELLDLIQINGLSILSAAFPSVNLTHEEIVSEIIATSGTKNADAIAAVSLAHLGALPNEVRLKALDQLVVTDSSFTHHTPLDKPGENTSEEEFASSYTFPTLAAASFSPTSPSSDAALDPYLAIFTQNSLAYWMDSSRLGESIRLKDDLTSPAPYYFQPELILEHIQSNGGIAKAVNPAPVAKLDQQLDIINQFLKSNPRLKTLANAQLKNEPQEDLSAKSSKIKKNLVSENLALIFIKQGKVKKAIKIYEQLIVKIPEKKSYFASQIEKLRNEP